MRARVRGTGWVATLALALAFVPQAADAQSRRSERPSIDERLAKLGKMEERVIRIGHRLSGAAAAAGWCDAAPTLGWTLGELGQYGKGIRQNVRSAWGIPPGASLFVAAVAPGSPASRAEIRPGTGIAAIAGMAPLTLSADGEQRLALANSERVIDGALATGSVEVELVQPDATRRTVRLVGTPGCKTRFEVVTEDDPQAYADGEIVQVTAGMSQFTEASDNQLAAVIAHELAHNILRHRERTEQSGTPRDYRRYLGRYTRLSRAMEEEADRLSVWLLQLAGYDPRAPIAFWERFGPNNDSPHPFGRTHSPWRERVIAVEAEQHAMRATLASDPRARPALLGRRSGASDDTRPQPLPGASDAPTSPTNGN